ncbi:E3 ubiquitin-protein ligase HOS1 [Arachis duranensis]|uniref:E3 ubiquitin-protein ligase HOS1 n=1 Tax=Arachis duranensis TaxID=130453 RepID=A0A6P4D7I9_ARADU|nr:E3 ubiquitin-protein ligase HOS1 [Arachis duranensis]
MDRRLNGPATTPSSSGGAPGTARSSSRKLQPNYSSPFVQATLERLASIDLIELWKEAKVEHCRATRDLRSCGRYVLHLLNSCGHASLCEECSQRCDICPICRIPIPKGGDRLRLRLYYECIEAGLISKRCDERFQEIEDGEKQRLYSLLDVALENNLVSLICHYITDVCMDETAGSSDPVIAFLLDEVVVKDWCKRTFTNIIAELQGIYNLDVFQMKEKLSSLLRFSLHLKGISNVLDILESSFKGTLSAQLHDLHHLQESVLKTKQHLEIIVWCTRHYFLENVRSRFTDSSSWASDVRRRKSEAIRRAWPDAISQSVESTGHVGSLFIEDALNNLDLEEGLIQGGDVASLQKDGPLVFQSDTDRVLGCYPFKNLHAAADLLFLRGSSDVVLAKQAIFLYYLYDRHWTIPDEEWRELIEDFAVTFNISRHSLLESFTFYLLDDDTEEALQEACRLLPEISGAASHPKIAEVLLERNSPDTALMVLRWAGRDGGPRNISLRDAVTAVRVRIECGLLTEAFMHQRILCTRVKEKSFNKGAPLETADVPKGQFSNWVEVLVTEICCLCIRRNLVDRMLELPWNSDEEKYIHKSLLDCATEEPPRTTGSLLVVFYMQRYRYSEAYQVHIQLEKLEQDAISKGSIQECLRFLFRIESTTKYLHKLTNRCLELLPEVEQQQLRSGNLTEGGITSHEEVTIPAKIDVPRTRESRSMSLLIPSSTDSSDMLHGDHTFGLLSSSTLGTSTKLGMPFPTIGPEFGNFGTPSDRHEGLIPSNMRFSNNQGKSGKIPRYDHTPTPKNHRIRFMNDSALKGANKTSPNNSQENMRDKMSPDERSALFSHTKKASPMYSLKASASPVIGSMRSHSKEFADNFPNISSKSVQSHKGDRSWNAASANDPMDVSWSHTETRLDARENINGGPRWRSDETSDEEEQGLERAMDIVYHATPTRTNRRSRFTKR